MNSDPSALSERIRELRRRHFGRSGKAAFADALSIKTAEYERFERGVLPDGELMVRMCEKTGEDLQWLLTGVAARGAVVISGARHRHQDLVARVASMLDQQPKRARPMEAFLDLLEAGERVGPKRGALPAPSVESLIPIFRGNELPDDLPDPDGGPGSGFSLATISFDLSTIEPVMCELSEPALTPSDVALGGVALLHAPDQGDPVRDYLQCEGVARCLPGSFGVWIDDDSMKPMFERGDVAIVTPGAEPEISRPALCKFADEPGVRCRVWLGRDASEVHLARVDDGQLEDAPADSLRWSLEILYRVARAA